jgi:hypothetical protein
VAVVASGFHPDLISQFEQSQLLLLLPQVLSHCFNGVFVTCHVVTLAGSGAPQVRASQTAGCRAADLGTSRMLLAPMNSHHPGTAGSSSLGGSSRPSAPSRHQA